MEKLGTQARDAGFMLTGGMGFIQFPLDWLRKKKKKRVNFSSRTAGGNRSWKRGWHRVLSPKG